ncbi:major facilitator superfamily transporter [Rhizoctonia solani]|uniref:Major facilitator superfamily transporter n=1 Tax=Rhizoctonia solani TaxID=456999 RepID=A0A8H8NS46_9AGAM|nr:major facilitator superfamily transporter [Rhizoctonia solani]QRW18904.1 major facilitator superfamily transporter [Rhizoctonia solani]
MSLPRSNSDTHSLDSDEKKPGSWDPRATADVVQYDKGVDEALDLVAGHADDQPVDPEEARRIRAKIDWVILPLLFALYTLQFVDKCVYPHRVRSAELNVSFKRYPGCSSVLGIIQDNHLTTDQFNTLGSAFYIGAPYLWLPFTLTDSFDRLYRFRYPHSWALQRFPVAKYLAANIFFWAILIGLHCVCKNFAGLFVLRFLLGASEGCITNGVMLVTSMFYTRTEIGERIGWTFQCNGFALITSGFLSFGVAHSSPNGKPARWQLLMIIYTGLTLIVGVWFLLLFPDSPVKARFLTKDEKVKAVRRIQSNQSGIETKSWKHEQAVEAVKDVKTWLFFLFAAISNLQNGFGTQYSLIIKSFGFTTLQTTALNIPAGVAMIISITLSTLILRRYPNARCWIAVAFFVPSVLAVILLITLPWHNRIGLLCAYYVLNFGGAPSFVMVLSWVTVTTSGHTKKLAVNAIFLVGYSLGQVLCTQFWRDEYKPRNYVPYAICLASYACDFILLFAIRYVLKKENDRRDALQAVQAQEDYGYVERVDSDGQIRDSLDREAHAQELQADLLRRQRLQQNVRMIEARDREERERQMISTQAEPRPLRVTQGDVRSDPQSSNQQERPKNVEDPWEKAKKEAPPEEPTSWQPQTARRR